MSYINKKWVERQFEKFAEKIKENFIHKNSQLAVGQDGITPHIDNRTKRWFIGETDTGIVAEGQKGDQGESGISPIITVQNIEGGHRLKIIDVNGIKSFDVMDGVNGSGNFENYIKSQSVENIDKINVEGCISLTGYPAFTFDDIKSQSVENVTELYENEV